MTPIFTPDFSKVDANIPTFEGRARVQVMKRTPFHKTGKIVDGNVKTNAGVRFNLEMVGLYDDDGDLQTEDLKGKTVSPYTVWLHTEGGWQFGKPFMMAACGYRRNQEAEANEKVFQASDWTCKGELDTAAETFEMGAGWDLPVGKLVDVTLKIDRQPSQNDPDEVYENQEFSGWTPIAA
jgi:hypothetical protein